jgi:cysteinyl-tRNA synthetase
MSKSLGNMTFVHDLLERFEPSAVRRFLLRRHYREDWHFDLDQLESEASGTVDREATKGDEEEPTLEAFLSALDDDLDTPGALGILERGEAAGLDWVTRGEEVLGLAGLDSQKRESKPHH